VAADVQGQRVAVGLGMLAQQSIPIGEDAQARVANLQAGGYTVVPVAIDGNVAGLLVIADTPRAASQQAVADLKALGIRETVLISGDNEAVAQAIGQSLGVDRVHAEVLPEEKLTFIREMQAAGRMVAFVGDGVNDAPALAVADVGIAMGTIGTNVALETADIVLLSDQLERLPALIALSRKTLTTVRNNVIFAMGMNVISVILSVSGVIGPVVGAVMHEVSALPVVANSARLIGHQTQGDEA
jgi:Cd2+/Zn2+-exporting ATPase